MLEIIQLTDVKSNIFNNGANSTSYVKSIHFHNTSDNDVTVFLHIVKSSGGVTGTPDDTNIILEEIVTSKETFEFSSSFPFSLKNENDAIFANASETNVVNSFILGEIV
jgi:hypothetical protein